MDYYEHSFVVYFLAYFKKNLVSVSYFILFNICSIFHSSTRNHNGWHCLNWYQKYSIGLFHVWKTSFMCINDVDHEELFITHEDKVWTIVVPLKNDNLISKIPWVRLARECSINNDHVCFLVVRYLLPGILCCHPQIINLGLCYLQYNTHLYVFIPSYLLTMIILVHNDLTLISKQNCWL